MIDSLRLRITVTVLLLIIVPLLLIATINGFKSSSYLRDQSLALQKEITLRVENELRSYIDLRVEGLAVLVNSVEFIDLDKRTKKSKINRLLMRQHVYQKLILLDANGLEEVHLSRTETIHPAEFQDRSKDEVFLFPKNSGQIYFGNVFFDQALREPLLTVALPIVNRRDNRFKHVLIAVMRFKEIWNFLSDISLPNSIEVYLAQEDGTIIAHQDMAKVISREIIDIKQSNGRGTVLDGENIIAVRNDLQLGNQTLTVYSTQPVSVAMKLVKENIQFVAGITFLILLLVAPVVVFLTYLLLKPIEVLAKAARTMSSGDLSVQVTEPARGEVLELKNAFNSMAERLKVMVVELESSEFAEKERALVTLRSIGDAVISTDASGIVNFINPIGEALTGWSTDEAVGLPLYDVFHLINEETRELAEDPVSRCLREGKVVGLANHTLLISREGEEYAIEDSASPICGKDGLLLGVVLVFKDVTEARRLSNAISYQATHDALTGLINRVEFERRLKRVVGTAQIEGTENALCYLDLDQFKLVNDTSGHIAGDELLRQIGQLLQENNRKRDTLARLGGDEFGLLLEHCSLEQAKARAESVVKVISEFVFPWEGRSFNIGVSIGMVAVNNESGSAKGILSAADAACYCAKDQGRSRVHVHQDDDKDLVKRHGEMQWAARLPRALEEERFRLYYQKIIPIGRENRSRNYHYELLLRMVDENGEIVSPKVFLPAAERYNLSDKLDKWVIQQACRWLQAHPEHLQRLNICSINLSGLSLSNDLFLPFVIHQIQSSGIPFGKICFEITETVAIANLFKATTFINRLSQLGCRFALDDFGSGLSSFGYLKNLPVDFLKIDGIFVRGIIDDPIDLAMVKAINEIGKVMGKKTIAEFVENGEILDKLYEIGVDYAQGYWFGKPEPMGHVPPGGTVIEQRFAR